MVKRLLMMMAGLLFSWALIAQPPHTDQAAVKSENEGITSSIGVHGHWKLEIFEPDGTLVRVWEFDNALEVGEGDSTLIDLLIGSHTSGGMTVRLTKLTGLRPCGTSSSDRVCWIGPPDMGHNIGWVNPDSNNLTETHLSSGGHKLELKGSVVIGNTTSIDSVLTDIKTCSTGSCIQCRADDAMGYGFDTLTRQTLSSAVPVVAGQIVQVTVTISFSTAP